MTVEKLEQVLETIGDKIDIIITAVDPDAIGSAFGIQLILSKVYEKKTKIYYCGEFADPQNRTIANRFNLLNIMSKIETREDESVPVCLVDSHEFNDSRLKKDLKEESVKIIIDHHRADIEKLDNENRFILIEEVGSASALVVEMIKDDYKIEYEEEYKTIYNLLALGIYTDTDSLLNATSRDMNAFMFLREKLDSTDVSRFVNYSLPPSYFKNFKSALTTVNKNGSRIVCSLGKANKKDRDNLARIANLILRWEGVTFVVVWAIIEDNVVMSFRNSDLTTPLDQFIKEKFDGLGGGKLAENGRGEGGAKIPLNMDFWLGEDQEELILELVTNRIESLVFEE